MRLLFQDLQNHTNLFASFWTTIYVQNCILICVFMDTEFIHSLGTKGSTIYLFNRYFLLPQNRKTQNKNNTENCLDFILFINKKMRPIYVKNYNYIPFFLLNIKTIFQESLMTYLMV
jgi:hypothetical protein